MKIEIPQTDELKALLGEKAFSAWDGLCAFLSQNYSMDILWGTGGKYGVYECKYRKSGKTLVTFYLKDKTFDLLIIFGAAEREKFVAERATFASKIQSLYDEARTYHDGKWMFIPLQDDSLNTDLEKMIQIKRKPNKKI